jgi:hypothetical protein
MSNSSLSLTRRRLIASASLAAHTGPGHDRGEPIDALAEAAFAARHLEDHVAHPCRVGFDRLLAANDRRELVSSRRSVASPTVPGSPVPSTPWSPPVAKA